MHRNNLKVALWFTALAGTNTAFAKAPNPPDRASAIIGANVELIVAFGRSTAGFESFDGCTASAAMGATNLGCLYRYARAGGGSEARELVFTVGTDGTIVSIRDGRGAHPFGIIRVVAGGPLCQIAGETLASTGVSQVGLLGLLADGAEAPEVLAFTLNALITAQP